MRLKKIFLLTYLLDCMVLHPVHAEEVLNNNGNTLHVEVSNNTGNNCVLKNKDLISGYLLTEPPDLMLPFELKFFDIKSLKEGPAIKLTYQCGSELIDFTSKQDINPSSKDNVKGVVFDGLKPLPSSDASAIPNDLWAYADISYEDEKGGSIHWDIKHLNSYVFTLHNETAHFVLKYDDVLSQLGKVSDKLHVWMAAKILPDPAGEKILPGQAKQFIIQLTDPNYIPSNSYEAAGLENAKISYQAINNNTNETIDCSMMFAHKYEDNDPDTALKLNDVYPETHLGNDPTLSKNNFPIRCEKDERRKYIFVRDNK